MKSKITFWLVLLLTLSCLVALPKAINHFQQPGGPVHPDFISFSEGNDVPNFLLTSARQAGFEVVTEPVLPGQWQISIAESPEKSLSDWLEHLNREGFSTQSIKILNTEKEGIVRVPSLTLISAKFVH